MKEGPLREILAKLDVEVVRRDDEGWLRCRCPFAELGYHDRGTDNTPSFFIKISASEISGFGCFTCKEHGRISSLVRKLAEERKEDYGKLALEADLAETPDSFEDYEKKAEYDADPIPLEKAAYMSLYPSAWSVPDARNYLVGRGISEPTATLLQLQYDDEDRRILFPVFDRDNELFGFTGRSIYSKEQIDETNQRRKLAGYKFDYPKVKDYIGLPKERLLLGENLIQPDKPLWVIEGLFAFAHMIEIGVRKICNPVAPMKSSISKYQRDLIIGYNLPTYLVFDDDPAGNHGTFGRSRDGAFYLLKQHVPTFAPLYPHGKTDPDFLTYDDVELMIIDPDARR
jgi:hypothetical protein